MPQACRRRCASAWIKHSLKTRLFNWLDLRFQIVTLVILTYEIRLFLVYAVLGMTVQVLMLVTYTFLYTAGSSVPMVNVIVNLAGIYAIDALCLGNSIMLFISR